MARCARPAAPPRRARWPAGRRAWPPAGRGAAARPGRRSAWALYTAIASTSPIVAQVPRGVGGLAGGVDDRPDRGGAERVTHVAHPAVVVGRDRRVHHDDVRHVRAVQACGPGARRRSARRSAARSGCRCRRSLAPASSSLVASSRRSMAAWRATGSACASSPTTTSTSPGRLGGGGRGRQLGQRLQPRQRPRARRVDLAAQLASGLGQAHRRDQRPPACTAAGGRRDARRRWPVPGWDVDRTAARLGRAVTPGRRRSWTRSPAPRAGSARGRRWSRPAARPPCRPASTSAKAGPAVETSPPRGVVVSVPAWLAGPAESAC